MSKSNGKKARRRAARAVAGRTGHRTARSRAQFSDTSAKRHWPRGDAQPTGAAACPVPRNECLSRVLDRTLKPRIRRAAVSPECRRLSVCALRSAGAYLRVPLYHNERFVQTELAMRRGAYGEDAPSFAHSASANRMRSRPSTSRPSTIMPPSPPAPFGSWP